MTSLPSPATAALAVRYTIFALIAAGANLATQWAALHLYGGPFMLFVAMAFGTAAALLTKYILDKHWIFNDRSTGIATHARKFTLYTVMGIGTTALFWATELLFDRLTPDGRYRFVGAVIGLVLGYATKYQLDRRFVFGAPT